MRRLAAILTGFALVLLVGCGEIIPAPGPSTEPTEPATTVFVPATIAYVPPTTAPWEPNDPPAKMEPKQGGKMLYTFPGKVPYEIIEDEEGEYPQYPLGLVNQDGKLVSPAIYHNVKYIYDEAKQRFIGVIAIKDREFTLYQLNGDKKVLLCDGFDIHVYPGGRYATVRAAEQGRVDCWSAWEPQKDGIYDIMNDKYVVEPKDGLLINYSGGVALGYQHDSIDAQGDEIAHWAFYCANENIIDLWGLGRPQAYYPETGWFGNYTIYDSDLQLILEDWCVDNSGFDGGEWCILSRFTGESGMTWINHKGELAEERYKSIARLGACFLARNNYESGPVSLYDPNLNLICTTEESEQLVWIGPQTDGTEAILLIDTNGIVKKAFDPNGKPTTINIQHWPLYTNAMYKEQNGNWRVLDLRPFYPIPMGDPYGGDDPYAQAIVVCDDYVIVETGIYVSHYATNSKTFAVDWQGNPYPNCPLKPYFGQLDQTYKSAGPQGRNYYWVETPTKRGYINTAGNWLFIDPTAYTSPS